MRINLIDNGHKLQEELFVKKLSEKLDITLGEGGLVVVFDIDPALGGEDLYEISSVDGGYRIVGGSDLGLCHGVGKFLHTASLTDEKFIPNPPSGLQKPACSFRAMYFSVHFYNWYHTASTEELENYLEDMVLWGYNAIHCIVPVINITTIGDDVFKLGVEKARRLYLLAKRFGMKTSLGVNVNQGVKSSPHEFDADQSLFPWRAGRNLCPSKPGAVEHLKTIWEAMLGQFTDIGLDFIQTWPYDEGGCSCEKCRPWGSNKYADLCITFCSVARRFYPNAKFILSTWAFEETEGGVDEFKDFYKRLETDLSFADYIMVDSHGEYPEYVRTHDAVKPVVNFPEISMWSLYPWGGFGANPLPRRFEELERSAKHIIAGGMPYSEGIYEDILKVQWAGYYWDLDRSYKDILSEYISYEYSPKVVDEVLEIFELVEKNHVAADLGSPIDPIAVFRKCETAVDTDGRIDLEAAHRARELALEVDAKLSQRAKKAWRWRIVLIRTLLDVKRYERYLSLGLTGEEGLWTLRRRSGRFLENDKEAQALMAELCEIYHCVDYNGQNRWTHPPVGGGDPADTLTIKLKEVDGE